MRWASRLSALSLAFAGTDNKEADPGDSRYGLGAFTKYLGPARWSFTYAGTHFSGVDWAYLKDGHYESGVAEIAARWLDRDLALAGTETTKFVFVHYPSGQAGFWPVLARHRVAMVFGGHSHRHKRFSHGGVAAMTTINLRGNGACTLGVVGENYVEVVNRCAGCKSDPSYHSKHCAMAWYKRPNHTGRRGELQEATDVQLAGGARPIGNVPTRDLEVIAEVEQRSARAVGLRIRPKDASGEPFEVCRDGDELVAGYLRIPFNVVPGKSLEQLHVVVVGGVAEIYVNKGLKLTVRCPLKSGAAVELFSTDGAAKFKNLKLWPLK